MSAQGPDVVDQLKGDLPSGWTATLVARDGSTTVDIKSQLKAMPQDATHLVVSVGGNNALGEKAMIEESARSVAEVLDKLAKIKAEFAKSYGAMLDGVLARKLPAAVCTIYEARYQDPTTRQIAGAGLTVFNDVIMREAFARGVPVIDLRLDVRRGFGLRQRHRAVGQRRGQDRTRDRHAGDHPRLHATAL